MRLPVACKPSLRAVVAAAALLAAGPSLATGPDAVLGDRAELYRALAGRYGDLFPQGQAAAPDTPVLALDVVDPERGHQRLLIPGSEGAEVDGSPSLVFEPESATAFVIWESQADAATSRVLLAGLHGEDWLDPVELTGDVDPLKGPPAVLITRDRYERPTVTHGVIEQARTLLHVVWWERGAGGGESVQYTPVVLEGGTYIGWNPVFRLNDLDPQAPSAAPPGAVPDLYSSPTLSAGSDLHTVMVAFADRPTARILTVEARVLPGELGLMAERLRAAVIATGYDRGPDRIASIRGILRSEIIEIGRRFNPGVISHFADAVVAAAQELHDAAPKQPLRNLADDLRSEIIEIGVNVLGDLNRSPRPKASRVLEASRAEAPEGSTAEAVPNLVRLRLVRELPAPAEQDGPARIYVSEDGGRLLVSWQKEDALLYVESLDGEDAGQPPEGEGAAAHWTEPRALDLGEELDLAAVEQILRARVLQRP